MSYVDIAILALVALFGVTGVLRGVKKSSLAFGAFLVAFVIAFFLAKVVAEALLGIEAIRKFVVGTDGFSLYTMLDKALVIGNDNSVAFNGATAPSAFLTEFFYKPMIDLVMPATSASFSPTNAVAMCTAFTIFSAMVGAGLFIVVRILLCLVTMIIKALIGKKKTWASRLGGFGVGIVRGACWSLVATLAISTIGGLTFMDGFAKMENEFERGVISPYFNQAAYAIKNKLFLPDYAMFERIIHKSGIKINDGDIDPEHDIAGYERDLFIEFMNLNYTSDAWTYNDKTGVIYEREGVDKFDATGLTESGFDVVVNAIMEYNERAADMIRTDRVLADVDNEVMNEFKTILHDSSNSIRARWLKLRTEISNYEQAIVDAKLLTSLEDKEAANRQLKSEMFTVIERDMASLREDYANFAEIFGALEFEMPEVFQLEVE